MLFTLECLKREERRIRQQIADCDDQERFHLVLQLAAISGQMNTLRRIALHRGNKLKTSRVRKAAKRI